MINAKTELQYQIALGILVQMRTAGFVTENEAAAIRRLAIRKFQIFSIGRRFRTARKRQLGISTRSSGCWRTPAIQAKMDTQPSLIKWGLKRRNRIFMKRRRDTHPKPSDPYCD